MRYGLCGEMKNGIMDYEIWIMYKEKKHKYEGMVIGIMYYGVWIMKRARIKEIL